MRIKALVFLALALLIHASGSSQIPGLPVIDFQRYFPHIVAISEEKADRAFPNGVQYKFLTVRDEEEKVVILALTRREGVDRLVRVFLASGPIENSEATLRSAVAKFSSTVQLKFEIVDLRELRTVEAFQAKASALGWGLEAIPR